MAANPKLIFLSLVSIVDISLFNYFGVSLTKYASAANRATVDLFRILFVWVFSVVFGLEQFNAYLLPGFLILSLGFCIYNELLIVPWWGLNQHVRSQRHTNAIEITAMSKHDSLLNLNRSNTRKQE